MQTSDLTIEVRNASLARVGQIKAVDIVRFQAVLRLRNVGSWSITLPDGHHLVDDLRTPGAGVIVTGPSGVILSGPMTSATFIADATHPEGDWEIKGVDDSVILGERLAYPDPGVSDVSAQTLEFDAQTGAAESLIYSYVSRNIGPLATTARKISNLTMGTDLGRGGTASASARFERLGELINPMAEAAGLGFDITQVGSNLVFEVFQPTDRSAYIRMDIENNQLTKAEYAYSVPATTRAIVAGQGEGINRALLESTTTASLASEGTWGRRIERFIDGRGGSTTAELTQAGIEELTVNGTTITKVNVSPTDDTTMRYGIDWNLGDKVSVVISDQTLSTTVTEVGIQMSKDGVIVNATIGQPGGFNFESKVAQKQVETENRVSSLERNMSVGASGSERQAAYVKNATGSAMTKGSIVYPTGSTGANNLVGLSKADAESTSSKTFGILDQDLANGSHGYAVTFGLLEDINTSGLTEGAAVYLSPTVAGGFTSTKPSAPNHMVLVGFCIRAHATTGRLFVKIQNGFELDELHDVAIGTKANDNLLTYDSTSGTWTNQTAAQANLIDLTTAQNVSGAKTFNSLVTANAGIASTFLTASTDLTVSGNATITGTLVADNAYITTGVATALTGWTVATALFRKRNGIAMINLGLTRTGAAIAAGNITNVNACTINVGYRPASESLAGGGPAGPVVSAYISAGGIVVITAIGTAIATGDNIDINATYILT